MNRRFFVERIFKLQHSILNQKSELVRIKSLLFARKMMMLNSQMLDFQTEMLVLELKLQLFNSISQFWSNKIGT